MICETFFCYINDINVCSTINNTKYRWLPVCGSYGKVHSIYGPVLNSIQVSLIVAISFFPLFTQILILIFNNNNTNNGNRGSGLGGGGVCAICYLYLRRIL